MLCLLAAPSFARADAKVAVDARTLDAPCRTVASVPDDARSIVPTLEAYVSAADCMAVIRTRALKLTVTQASVDALDAAIRPSIDLLDTVIEQGDVARQIVAQHAKADLYQGLAVRLLNTVPPVPPTMVGRALADHAHQVDVATDLVRPWRARALRAHRAVARLADKAPRLVATNPVLAYAVGDSKLETATGVASR
ncbi:MAG: hypothetical protein ACM31C_10705 [Acidobacteriota bacterium]